MKLYLSGSSKSETALTVLQLHHPELLCYGRPHHLAQAHTVQQHRAPSPAALLLPSPAFVFLVIDGEIDYIIPLNGIMRITNVHNVSTLVLSLVVAVVDALNLTAVADADLVVVSAVAVVTVTVLLFYAF